MNSQPRSKRKHFLVLLSLVLVLSLGTYLLFGLWSKHGEMIESKSFQAQLLQAKTEEPKPAAESTTPTSPKMKEKQQAETLDADTYAGETAALPKPSVSFGVKPFAQEQVTTPVVATVSRTLPPLSATTELSGSQSPYETEDDVVPWFSGDNKPFHPGSVNIPDDSSSKIDKEEEPKVNTPFFLLADYSHANILFVPKQNPLRRSAEVSGMVNLAAVQEAAYKALASDEERARLYFLELDNEFIIVDLNDQLIGVKHESAVSYEGKIYAVGEQNLLQEATEQQLQSSDNPLFLVAGEYRNADHLLAANHVLGLPGNRFNARLALFESGKMIAGLNFEARDLPDLDGANHSLISISSKGVNLVASIDHNRFSFAEDDQTTSVYRAIAARTVAGSLVIEHNYFTGNNRKRGLGTAINHAIIQTMSVLRENELQLTIQDNIFRKIASLGIEVYAGSRENVKILRNRLDQIGEEGIKVDLPVVDYPNFHRLQIAGNQVKNYGMNPHQNYSNGGAGVLAPSNEGENGISLLYYNGVQYGSFVNEKWHSTIEQLTKTIILANDVMSAADNNQNQDVVSSLPVRIGPTNYYVNTAEKINVANQYGLARHSLVIVKEENGDVVFGHDPQQPTSLIEVDNLYITGPGAGVVNLPSTLKVKGNLIIELPNGQVKSEATVLGEEKIAAGRLQNAATFVILDRQAIPRGGYTPTYFDIQITDVKNDKGQTVTNPQFTVEVLLNNRVMSPEDYVMEGQLVRIKNTVINQLTRNARLLLRICDEANEISQLTSPIMLLELFNRSAAKFIFSTDKIYHLDADPITVQVSGLKNNKGEDISSEQSILKGNVSFITESGRPVADHLLVIDDTKDEITLPASLLNQLSATEYGSDRNTNVGFRSTYRLVISDSQNQIFDAQGDLDLRVVDLSGADFVFEQGKTFTEGQAPSAGLTLYVRDVRNTRGQRISAAQTRLALDGGYSNLHIEPFPVSREDDETKSELIVLRDEQGEFIREIFNPRFYAIDDETDSITFTQEYLNMIKPQKEASTEHGIKIFTFALRDAFGKVDTRGFKTPLHIKLLDRPLSTNTEISFVENTYEIKGEQIVRAKNTSEQDLMVAGFLKHVRKHNPRQQVLVVRDGKILRPYDTLAEGDALKVIAEDGKTTVQYALSLNLQESSLKDWLLSADQGVVAEYNELYLIVRQSQSVPYVAQVLGSLTLAEGVSAKIVQMARDGEAFEPVRDNPVTADMFLLLKKGNEEQRLQLRLEDGVQYRALLIGNSNYNSEKLNLKGPVNDLQLMKTVFQRNKFGNQRFSTVAVKENVLKQDFLTSIKMTFDQATDEDVSYIYYSGHGFNADDVSYLCTVDPFTSEDMAENVKNWISVNELKEALDQIRGRKVLILDSCNAGGFIGKNFVDAVSGATGVPGHSGHASHVDEHRDELATVFSENVRSTFEENKNLNYLTTQEYKVLVASSANEFSYEDKQKALGKFTEKLAKGVGFENGQMFADKNADRLVSLSELYQYLMDEVESTSHIQVFPHLDQTPIFADLDAGVLSDEVRVDVKNNAYQLSFSEYMVQGKKQWRGLIKSQQVRIANIAVADFLSNLIPLHPAQKLEVVRSENREDTVMSPEELMVKQTGFLYYLQVTAENGSSQKFPVVVEKEVRKVTPETDISITSNDERIKVTARDPAYAIKLTEEMSSQAFIQALQQSNAAKNQQFKLYSSRKASQKEISAVVQVKNRDVLEVIAPDGITKQDYNITVVTGGGGLLPNPGNGDGAGSGGVHLPELPAPDFGDAFIISGTEIRSGNVRLTAEMTVADFLQQMRNKETIFRQADAFRSGIYPTRDTVTPWMRAKQLTDKLSSQDTLRIFTLNNKVHVYQIILADN